MMTINALLRPVRVFDPSITDHRKYFYEFERTNSWKNCPYQWAIDDGSFDVVYHIKSKLVKYYINGEFNKKTVKTTVKHQILKIQDIKVSKTA
jgi:hypothetical protein